MASGADARTESQKKTEALKEMQHLKTKILNLERDKKTHLYQKHSEFMKDFQQLQEVEIQGNTERKAEQVKLSQQLQKIKNMVKRFRRQLQDVKPTPEFVEKLKSTMEDIEGQITSLKEQQKQDYEDLMRNERITSQEILLLDKKFDSWASAPADPTPRITGTARSAPLSDRGRNLPPEVMVFDRFVSANGGPRGGWDEYDHGTFLKYRNRHKGKLSFIQELASFLPTKTAQEIREHEKWFQEYNRLNEEKKEAISKWKEQKQVQKENILHEAKTEEEISREEEEQRELKKKRDGLERMEKKALLNKWKVEKELEKAEEEARKLRMELAKTKKEEEDEQRRLEERKKLEEYKAQRTAEEQLKQLEEDMKEETEREARRKANHNLHKFQHRDVNIVSKKLKQKQQKEKEEEEKRKRIQRMKGSVEISVERDPNRLLQPTAGWRERQKEAGQAGTGRVLHMPHRAVPSWRQGMM